MEKMAYVSRALTKHTHYQSPYECYDNCGTCDGANCDRCHERWEVSYLDSDKPSKIFYTLEEAEAAKEAYEKGEET